ncbi:MAG TPA: FtsX-like permease family protein [Thermoanaerobaculaceae bacterium]|nr:FtsX-like permease family protein [Thermoanaerobaculaceae bacterium]
MNRHSWREVKRQLRESGPAGLVAVVLVMVASAWGGVLWSVREWVRVELLARDRQTMVVAVARGEAEAATLGEALRARFPSLATVSLTPRKVQEQLATWFPELSTVLLTLDERSFPPIVQVEVTPDQEEAVASFLRSRSEVTLAESSRGWQARLEQAVSRLFFAGFVLALTLLVGCWAVVLLVVRLLVLNHADEIAIMRLIGAHEGDIRRPYLISGSLLGAAGGVLGAALLLSLQFALRTALPALAIQSWVIAALPPAGGLTAAAGAALGLAALPREP